MCYEGKVSNSAPTDTAVPFSNSTPSWCQQAPSSPATEDLQLQCVSFYFNVFNPATSHPLEANENENKVGEPGVEAHGPRGLSIQWEPKHMFLLLLFTFVLHATNTHLFLKMMMGIPSNTFYSC